MSTASPESHYTNHSCFARLGNLKEQNSFGFHGQGKPTQWPHHAADRLPPAGKPTQWPHHAADHLPPSRSAFGVTGKTHTVTSPRSWSFTTQPLRLWCDRENPHSDLTTQLIIYHQPENPHSDLTTQLIIYHPAAPPLVCPSPGRILQRLGLTSHSRLYSRMLTMHSVVLCVTKPTTGQFPSVKVHTVNNQPSVQVHTINNQPSVMVHTVNNQPSVMVHTVIVNNNPVSWYTPSTTSPVSWYTPSLSTTSPVSWYTPSTTSPVSNPGVKFSGVHCSDQDQSSHQLLNKHGA